jgi:hypothetical protein
MNGEVTDQERKVILHYLKNSDFVGCPAQIESTLGRSITRAWAKKVCERLVSRGILGKTKRRPKRHRTTTDHYFLRKNDRRAFLEAAKIFLSDPDPTLSRALIESVFCQNHLDYDLVEEILNARGILMRMEFSRPLSPEERRVVDSVPDGELGTERANEAAMVEWNTMFEIIFPVLRQNVPIETKVEQVKSINPGVFRSMFATGVFGQSFLEVVRQHYDNTQKSNLVLPIRTLVQVSPSALNEFLFGDWRPSSIDESFFYCSANGTVMIDHVLVSLLFKAVGDVAATRSVPSKSSVEAAFFRGPYLPKGDERQALIEFRLRKAQGEAPRRMICFDARFNTVQLTSRVSHEGESQQLEIMLPNPSGCSFETWTKDVPQDVI